MSIVKMPRYEIYWSKVTRYEPVASTLILKRYKKLPEFLHVVVVNVEKGKLENKEDKYFQVKTLLEAIMANCQKMEMKIIDKYNNSDMKIIDKYNNSDDTQKRYFEIWNKKL